MIPSPFQRDPANVYVPVWRLWSQRDEDGILTRIIDRLGLPAGRFVEIGVDAHECNTRILVEDGWTGRWIDQRPGATVPGVERIRTRVTLGNVVELVGRPDVLSIDVDGNDSWLLAEVLRDGARPAVIICEYEANYGPVADWRDDYDPNWTWDGREATRRGTSFALLRRLGWLYGYALVACTLAGNDAFLVRDASAFPFANDDRHYSPHRALWLAKRRPPKRP